MRPTFLGLSYISGASGRPRGPLGAKLHRKCSEETPPFWKERQKKQGGAGSDPTTSLCVSLGVTAATLRGWYEDCMN